MRLLKREIDGMKNKVIIVSPYDNYSYPVRTKYIENYFINKGFFVQIVAGDFNHRTKSYYEENRDGLSLLHVKSYKKNISIYRILSHIGFARQAMKLIKSKDPNILYICTPPNILFLLARRYKSINKECRIIIDIGDMWPETLPVEGRKRKILSPFLYMWKNIRDVNLEAANAIVFECDLFRNYLSKLLMRIPNDTIYLCKRELHRDVADLSNINGKIVLVYLGSLNNIFDADLTSTLINELQKYRPIELHIIGDGEQKAVLINKITNAAIIDHGIVYDEAEKIAIYNKCHFAINIMKPTVFVGLTMKSIDYFAAGLPIVNNISGDTEKIIKEYKCGYNFMGDLDSLVSTILNTTDENINEMRKNSKEAFERNFTEECMYKKMETLLKGII